MLFLPREVAIQEIKDFYDTEVMTLKQGLKSDYDYINNSHKKILLNLFAQYDRDKQELYEFRQRAIAEFGKEE